MERRDGKTVYELRRARESRVNEPSMVDRLSRLNAGMHERGTQSRSRDQGLMTSVTGTKDNALDGDAPSYIYRVVESMAGK